MRDYIQRNFVDKEMCAQFVIHDSENSKTGQRNLHCHIMLTMRSLDEQGKWMPKQKKVYLTDENGERIPQIHLGEKASAMEHAGIRMIRGDINRDIIVRNAVIDAARVMYEKAKEGLQAAKAVPVTVAKAIKNDIS